MSLRILIFFHFRKTGEGGFHIGVTARFDYASRVGENENTASLVESGPVAQLGARFHGMEEVVGSIPTRSTKFLNQNSYHIVHARAGPSL
jgi:hypothetical protein